MSGVRLTGSVDGADRIRPRVLEDQQMYPTEHPTTAMVLAHYRIQEDIARAEAYRAARNARAYRAVQSGARKSRRVGHSRGVRPFAALRAALRT